MLKIKDNVDLKELEKYKIYPKYECNERTGQTIITELRTDICVWEKLRFVKKKKIIAIRYCNKQNNWFLKLNRRTSEVVDVDTLYDLIKDGLVEKVGENK